MAYLYNPNTGGYEPITSQGQFNPNTGQQMGTGSYLRPPLAPPGSGGGGGGGGGTPNPGDVDPLTGNRWMSGMGWQPSNMFSDLGGGGGYDYSGGGGGGGGGLAVAPPVQPPGAPAGAPSITPWSPGAFPTLAVPEALGGYVPQQYQAQYGPTMQNWLNAMGYQGTGTLGRYGETVYNRPSGWQGQAYFDPALFQAILDPKLREWIQYLFGEQGYTARYPYPGGEVTH